MKLKVLIVDDEPIIRKGIMSSIDWASQDISVSEASNGQEALEKVFSEAPHIVITDIRMPVMTGLELCRHLHEQAPEIKIIVLTGYDDFSYAQQAIQYNVSQYVLKPFGAEDLFQAIIELGLQMKADYLKEEKRLEKEQLLQENLEVILMRFFQDLLHISETTESKLYFRAETLGLPLIGPCYKIVLLTVDQYALLTESFDQRSLQDFRTYILSLLREGMKGHPVILTDSGRSHFLMLFNLPTLAPHLIEDLIKGLITYLALVADFSITAYAGKSISNLREIEGSYTDALCAYNQRLYVSTESIHYSHDHPFQREIKAYDLELEKKIISQLRNADLSNLNLSIDAFFNLFITQLTPSDIVYDHVQRLMMALDRLATEIGFESFTADYQLSELAKYETLEELKDFIHQRITVHFETADKHKKNSSNHLITAAQQYVQQHYAQPITLRDIAQKIYVTPNYFCKVFKRETNENFVDWLNRYRIEKAKELIRQSPHLKTYEIAENVGFANYKYFTQLFKRHVGTSPKDFKNGWRS